MLHKKWPTTLIIFFLHPFHLRQTLLPTPLYFMAKSGQATLDPPLFPNSLRRGRSIKCTLGKLPHVPSGWTWNSSLTTLLPLQLSLPKVFLLVFCFLAHLFTVCQEKLKVTKFQRMCLEAPLSCVNPEKPCKGAILDVSFKDAKGIDKKRLHCLVCQADLAWLCFKDIEGKYSNRLFPRDFQDVFGPLGLLLRKLVGSSTWASLMRMPQVLMRELN